MQAILRKDCWGPNPKYDPSKPKHEETNWPERIVPRGTILNHPDAHYHCYGDDPNADPHDDECKEIVRQNNDRRAKIVAARAEQDGELIFPEGAEPDQPAAEPEKQLTPVLPAKKNGKAKSDAE